MLFESKTYEQNDISLRFVVNIDEAFYAFLVDKVKLSHLLAAAHPRTANLKLNVLFQ